MKALITVLALIVVLGLGYFLYSSPTSPAEMTQAEIAQIEAEVTQVAEDWIQVWRDNDCALSRDIWHPEHIAQPRAGRISPSVQDWIDSCTQTTANRASAEGEWMETSVRVLSPDAAVFSGTYSWTMHYRDGSPAQHWPTAAQTHLYERTETGWGLTFFVNANGPVETVEQEN